MNKIKQLIALLKEATLRGQSILIGTWDAPIDFVKQTYERMSRNEFRRKARQWFMREV